MSVRAAICEANNRILEGVETNPHVMDDDETNMFHSHNNSNQQQQYQQPYQHQLSKFETPSLCAWTSPFEDCGLPSSGPLTGSDHYAWMNESDAIIPPWIFEEVEFEPFASLPPELRALVFRSVIPEGPRANYFELSIDRSNHRDNHLIMRGLGRNYKIPDRSVYHIHTTLSSVSQEAADEVSRQATTKFTIQFPTFGLSPEALAAWRTEDPYFGLDTGRFAGWFSRNDKPREISLDMVDDILLFRLNWPLRSEGISNIAFSAELKTLLSKADRIGFWATARNDWDPDGLPDVLATLIKNAEWDGTRDRHLYIFDENAYAHHGANSFVPSATAASPLGLTLKRRNVSWGLGWGDAVMDANGPTPLRWTFSLRQTTESLLESKSQLSSSSTITTSPSQPTITYNDLTNTNTNAISHDPDLFYRALRHGQAQRNPLHWDGDLAWACIGVTAVEWATNIFVTTKLPYPTSHKTSHHVHIVERTAPMGDKWIRLRSDEDSFASSRQMRDRWGGDVGWSRFNASWHGPDRWDLESNQSRNQRGGGGRGGGGRGLEMLRGEEVLVGSRSREQPPSHRLRRVARRRFYRTLVGA